MQAGRQSPQAAAGHAEFAISVLARAAGASGLKQDAVLYLVETVASMFRALLAECSEIPQPPGLIGWEGACGQNLGPEWWTHAWESPVCERVAQHAPYQAAEPESSSESGPPDTVDQMSQTSGKAEAAPRAAAVVAAASAQRPEPAKTEPDVVVAPPDTPDAAESSAECVQIEAVEAIASRTSEDAGPSARAATHVCNLPGLPPPKVSKGKKGRKKAGAHETPSVASVQVASNRCVDTMRPGTGSGQEAVAPSGNVAVFCTQYVGSDPAGPATSATRPPPPSVCMGKGKGDKTTRSEGPAEAEADVLLDAVLEELVAEQERCLNLLARGAAGSQKPHARAEECTAAVVHTMEDMQQICIPIDAQGKDLHKALACLKEAAAVFRAQSAILQQCV